MDSYYKSCDAININEKTPFILSIILIMICVDIYFLDFLKSYLLIEILYLLLFCIYIFFIKRRLFIPKYSRLIILFCIYLVVNIFTGGNEVFVCAFILNIILLVFLSNTPYVSERLSKIMVVCASIHLFFTMLVQVLPTQMINKIFSIILGSNYWSNWDWRIQQNSNLGITNQPGNNAMYLTTLLAFCIAHIIANNKKSKIIYWICLVFTIIGIISTAKRAPIIFNIISFLGVYIIYNRKKISINKVFKVVAVIILGVTFIVILYKTTNIFSGIIDKNINLSTANDITNGRLELWNIGIEKFKEKPIMGVGVKSIYKEIGLDVHNIYIQMLAEVGLVGFIVFILGLFAIIFPPIKNIKYLRYNNDNKVKRSVLMGIYLIIYMTIYGFVGNPFIDYIPFGIFVCSSFMANSYRFLGVRK